LIAHYGSEGEDEEHMKMFVVGAMGMPAVQVLLVVGYLDIDKLDPIILNPDS
jgi:hypothetical protein